MAIKRGRNKGFNKEQISDMEVFVASLGVIANKNMAQVAMKNPRHTRIVLSELKVIAEELQPVEIVMADIDVNRCLVERNIEKSEVEKYLWNNPVIVSQGLSKLKEMQQNEIYNLKNPIGDREAKIAELEEKIAKYKDINIKLRALGAGNDAERNEEKIEGLQAQIDSIRATFNTVTIEEIQFDLYSFASAKLNGLKNNVNDLIEYLTEIVEVQASGE